MNGQSGSDASLAQAAPAGAQFGTESSNQAASARPAISALDQAMAATLAAISVPSPLNGTFCLLTLFVRNVTQMPSFTEDSTDAKPSPSSDSRTSTPEPKAVFKDKKEALEAFKDLLKEKVKRLSTS